MKRLRQFLFGWRYPIVKQIISANGKATLKITKGTKKVTTYHKIYAWGYVIRMEQGVILKSLEPMVDTGNFGSLYFVDDMFRPPYGTYIIDTDEELNN